MDSHMSRDGLPGSGGILLTLAPWKKIAKMVVGSW